VTGHGVILGLAIAAAGIAAVPLFAYPFVSDDSVLNPYRSRAARWIVWMGGATSLVLFFILTH
jgi:hypothetical protein